MGHNWRSSARYRLRDRLLFGSHRFDVPSTALAHFSAWASALLHHVVIVYSLLPSSSSITDIVVCQFHSPCPASASAFNGLGSKAISILECAALCHAVWINYVWDYLRNNKIKQFTPSWIVSKKNSARAAAVRTRAQILYTQPFYERRANAPVWGFFPFAVEHRSHRLSVHMSRINSRTAHTHARLITLYTCPFKILYTQFNINKSLCTILLVIKLSRQK